MVLLKLLRSLDMLAEHAGVDYLQEKVNLRPPTRLSWGPFHNHAGLQRMV